MQVNGLWRETAMQQKGFPWLESYAAVAYMADTLAQLEIMDDLTQLLRVCRRQLEDYPDHPGLLILSGFCRVATNFSEQGLTDIANGFAVLQRLYEDPSIRFEVARSVLLHAGRLMPSTRPAVRAAIEQGDPCLFFPEPKLLDPFDLWEEHQYEEDALETIWPEEDSGLIESDGVLVEWLEDEDVLIQRGLSLCDEIDIRKRIRMANSRISRLENEIRQGSQDDGSRSKEAIEREIAQLDYEIAHLEKMREEGYLIVGQPLTGFEGDLAAEEYEEYEADRKRYDERRFLQIERELERRSSSMREMSAHEEPEGREIGS
jgi:hypothetical protein